MVTSTSVARVGLMILAALTLFVGVHVGVAMGTGTPEWTPSAGAAAPAAKIDSAFAMDVTFDVYGSEVIVDTLVLSVSASGEAEASRRVVVTADVAGRVHRVGVRDSDRVTGGTVVVALDADQWQLALHEARVALREAERRYRELLLFDSGLPDDVRRERQSAARLMSGLERAEIQMRRAELDLDRTRVRTPFAGRVASVRVLPGARIRQGVELLTVLDVDPMAVHVRVLESDLAHLTSGGAAQLRFTAFPNEVFLGRVQSVNPVVENTTRTARVTVLVPNPGERIFPGMHARATLDALRLPDRVLVPRAAILERDRRTMVFVHSDGRARWRYVTVGQGNDEYVEILDRPDTEMVAAGDVVLTGGHFTLTHGARIRLVDE